jgi:hypothetical protein
MAIRSRPPYDDGFRLQEGSLSEPKKSIVLPFDGTAYSDSESSGVYWHFRPFAKDFNSLDSKIWPAQVAPGSVVLSLFGIEFDCSETINFFGPP